MFTDPVIVKHLKDEEEDTTWAYFRQHAPKIQQSKIK